MASAAAVRRPLMDPHLCNKAISNNFCLAAAAHRRPALSNHRVRLVEAAAVALLALVISLATRLLVDLRVLMRNKGTPAFRMTSMAV